MAAGGKRGSIEPLAAMLDHMARSAIARGTGGLSPATMQLAFMDWWMHLATAPGEQLRIAAQAAADLVRLFEREGLQAWHEPATRALEGEAHDRRFAAEAWQRPPYRLAEQFYQFQRRLWDQATTGVPGVKPHNEAIVSFFARQFVDMISPSNSIAANPAVQQRLFETRGMALADGMLALAEDFRRLASGKPPVGCEDFPVGTKLAATPGQVVLRNELMELIQYSPTTEKVQPEPVLFVPAWIMKYYILDLSPHNSMVKYLVDQGFTVFMISWRNPGAQQRDLGMADYLAQGPLAALEAVQAITGSERVHAAGYCLGGTLLAIAAAALAQRDDERLASLTLFAAQTDFTEPGELGIFIDESQVNMLEAMMWETGYLDTNRMGGAFQMLRANDLLWGRAVKTYLMGERDEMIDLMAWNADGTRMPYAMHTQYLRQMFLGNELARGRFRIEGRPLTISAVEQPWFVVGTKEDHVAPWRSVHKLHQLTDAEITFVLAKGGHNAGIISEPGHPRRDFLIGTRAKDRPAVDPAAWLDQAESREGSWWPVWCEWLARHSGDPVAPPPTGAPADGLAPLCAAPGTYVMER